MLYKEKPAEAVLLRDEARGGPVSVLSWEEFLARGEPAHEAELDKRSASIDPGECALLVYTSGPTPPRNRPHERAREYRSIPSDGLGTIFCLRPK